MMVVGWGPYALKWCSMHVLNLGVLQYFAGSCTELLMSIGSTIELVVVLLTTSSGLS